MAAFCAFFRRDEQQAGKLVLAGTMSDDHGGTWSQPTVLLDSPDGHDYDPSIMAIGPRVIVSATTTPLNESAITTSRIIAVRSEDSGRTWSKPFEIPTGRRYTSGKINNGIVLKDGTALLGYTWEKNLDTGRIQSLATEGEMEEVNAVLLSLDEGRTWTSSESVGLATRRADTSVTAINGLCEPALVECEDGSVFMLSRTGLTNLYGARSTNGGRRWSEPYQTSLVSHNAPAAMCKFRGEKSGVLAVWNNSPEHRWPLSVAASFDGCRTWTPPARLPRLRAFNRRTPAARNPPTENCSSSTNKTAKRAGMFWGYGSIRRGSLRLATQMAPPSREKNFSNRSRKERALPASWHTFLRCPNRQCCRTVRWPPILSITKAQDWRPRQNGK